MEKELEEMRKELSQAIDNGEVAKRDLGDMRSINKILKGECIKLSTIKLAYSKLPEAMARQKAKNPTKVKAGKSKPAKEGESKIDSQILEESQNQEQQGVIVESKIEPKILEKSQDKERESKIEPKILEKSQDKERESKIEPKIEDSKVEIQSEPSEQLSLIVEPKINAKILLDEIKNILVKKEVLAEVLDKLAEKLAEKILAQIKGISINPPKEKREQILGFSLSLVKGLWYATKNNHGKTITVYVGRDYQEAEKKIKAYCEKKGLTVSQ